LQGSRLVLATMGLFLGPIVLAIVAATCFGESQIARFAGALVSFGGGMALSVAVARWLWSGWRQSP